METISILREGGLTQEEELFVAQFLQKKDSKHFVDLMRKVVATCEEERLKKIYMANSKDNLFLSIGEARVFNELGKLFNTAQLEELAKAMSAQLKDTSGLEKVVKIDPYMSSMQRLW